MKPAENDVLSGRGSWFNQHPGNERFRRIIEEQKAVYIQGTKKQKMNMSNAIVESIYSMEPPGRFLKKCPDTGRWSELSKREASDRVAQAMAYAVRGKEKLKQQREERRRSRTSSRQKSKDDAAALSSQSADRPAQLRSNNNEFEDSGSSSATSHDGMVARGGGAVGTNNKAHSANELLLPDTSNLQQQLLQQLLQSSSTTLPTSSSVSPTIDPNGLARLLVQTLQQQQLQQQQQQHLPLQHTLGQDSLGIQTQTPLQPALLERLTELLNQTQQHQQNEQQHQLLLQRLLNQQTVVPPATLLPTLSLSAPFLTGPRSHPANSNLLQNQVHLQSNPSNNALLLSMLSTSLHQPNSANDVGISNAPQGAQQMDQLQRSLMLQHQQLLASSLGASSNDRLPFQQQQSQPLDALLRQAMQAALKLRQNSQGHLPPPPVDFAALAAANAAAQSSRQE